MLAIFSPSLLFFIIIFLLFPRVLAIFAMKALAKRKSERSGFIPAILPAVACRNTAFSVCVDILCSIGTRFLKEAAAGQTTIDATADGRLLALFWKAEEPLL